MNPGDSHGQVLALARKQLHVTHVAAIGSSVTPSDQVTLAEILLCNAHIVFTDDRDDNHESSKDVAICHRRRRGLIQRTL